MPLLKSLYEDHVKSRIPAYSDILHRLNIDCLIIHSGMSRYKFLDDQSYPFKVNPHFNYWVPLQENPHCFLWLEQNKRPTLFYYKKTDFWHKMPEDPSGFWTDSFDIIMVSDGEEVRKHLGSKLSRAAYIGDWAEHFTQWSLGMVNPEALLNELHFLRTTKTPYEVFCLREANRMGAMGHKKAEEAFYQGYSEFEIEMEYIKKLMIQEIEQPYNHIVALNENAAVLHYNNGEKLRPSKDNLHTLLIDAGYGYLGYASDITRTYAYQKGEFQDLLSAMEEMQLKIVRELKLGVLYTENHLKSHHEIAKILRDFQFVKMPTEEIVEKKISHAFFPHGLGHFLGLQVHDVGGYLKDAQGHKNKPPADHPYLRCTSEIRAGHVFTIEPGLYFIPSLLLDLRKSEHASAIHWEKVERFMKYGGIRIEDNIYAHQDGFENLTRDAFALLDK